MKEFKPYTQNTIPLFIQEGKNLIISEDTMAFKEKIDHDIIIPCHNIITKHYNAIKNYIDEFTFTDDEFVTYKFQPQKYCYATYGTPELASSLLYINNMISRLEFNKKNIKIFRPSSIMDIIKELMSLSEYDLKKNKLSLK